MKILHTADIHLGAKNLKLDIDRQNYLKNEELLQLKNLFEKAYKEDYDAFLICGDLFHSKNLPAKLYNSFFSMVEEFMRPVIYIKGNHDENNVLIDKLPDNFIVLDENRPNFRLDSVVFWGQVEPSIIASNIDKKDFNILMLHGNINNKNDRDFVDINVYNPSSFDYIALGHIHSYDIFKSGETTTAYSGSLFSNGFDETGDKGYIDVELYDKGNVKATFMPYSAHRYMICNCDITDLEDFRDILSCVKDNLKICTKQDLVRVVLNGYVTENCDKFLQTLKAELSDYLYIEIVDNSKLKIDFDKIKNEELSFKAEFLMLVEKSEEGEDAKNKICQIGIEALRGDDISLWL